MKKWRAAIILALVFLALGGLATWDEWQTKRDDVAEKAKNKVTDVKVEDVVELDYASKPDVEDHAPAEDDEPKVEGEVRVSAVKKDGVWRLTKPVDALADTQTIESLIKGVVDYAGTKEISSDREKWSDFGLLDPVRTITVRAGGDQAQKFSIFVGNKVPVGFSVYYRTNKDDKVLMGGQQLLVSTSKTLYDFRDKSLVKIEESKLKSLTYARLGDPAIEIVKNDGKYAITKPEALDADGPAIKEFVDELNLIRVAGFLDRPDAALVAAFQAPSFELTWTGETGEASTLKFLDKDGKLFASFNPAERVYTLPEDFRPKLQKDLSAFRNRRILATEILDVQKADVDGTTYKAIEGNWYLEADAAKFDDQGKFKGDPKDTPKEQAHMRAFMVDLEFAKTDRFILLTDPISKSLTSAPAHRITLSYATPAKAPMVIELFEVAGEPQVDKYLVRRSNAPYIYRVAKSAFASMVPPKEPSPGEEPSLDVPEGEESEQSFDLENPHENASAQ